MIEQTIFLGVGPKLFLLDLLNYNLWDVGTQLLHFMTPPSQILNLPHLKTLLAIFI